MGGAARAWPVGPGALTEHLARAYQLVATLARGVAAAAQGARHRLLDAVGGAVHGRPQIFSRAR